MKKIKSILLPIASIAAIAPILSISIVKTNSYATHAQSKLSNQTNVMTAKASNTLTPVEVGVIKGSDIENQNDYSSDVLATSSQLLAKTTTANFNSVVVTRILNIINRMNQDLDYSWHAIGDPTLDSINAIRYAIKESANGNNAGKDDLAHIITYLMKDKLIINANDTEYTTPAKQTIISWLSGKNSTPSISTQKIPGDWQGDLYTVDQLKQMEALKLDTKLMQFAEYRTQQIEWNGFYDWGTPGSLASDLEAKAQKDNNPIGNHGAENTSMLSSWTSNFPDINSERYITPISPTSNSDSRALTSTFSETNIYTGFARALKILFADEEGEVGETNGRTALFAPNIDSLGYSLVINENRLNPFPAVIFETGDNFTYYEHTAQGSAAYKQNLTWIGKVFGNDALNYVIYNNVKPIDLFAKIYHLNPSVLSTRWFNTWFNTNIVNAITNNTQYQNSTDGAYYIEQQLQHAQTNLALSSPIFIDNGTPTTTFPTTLDNNFSINKNLFSSYALIGYDYQNKPSHSLGQYDILGNGNMIGHIEGYESSEIYADFFKWDGTNI